MSTRRKRKPEPLLSTLRSNALQRRNVIAQLTARLFGAAGMALVAPPLVQSFMLKVGLTKGQIGTIGSVASISGAAGMCLLMGVSDRIERRVRTVVLCSLVAVLTPVALAALSLLGAEFRTAGVVFAVLAAVALLRGPIESLGAMVSSALYVRTMHVHIRGRVTGINGLIAGVTGALFGLIGARILQLKGFPAGYALCFGLAPLFIMAGAAFRARLVELPELQRPGRRGSAFPWAAIWEVLKLREFRVLLGPNLLRGFGTGVVYFVWIVGKERLDLPAEYAGMATTVSAVAGNIFGSIAIGLTVDRWGPGFVCLLSEALTAFALVAVVLTGSPALFLAFFGLSVFGGTILANAVPLGTYEVAPAELMGAYNGARLMLLPLGGAVAMPAVGVLLQHYDPLPVFAAGALLHLVTGAWYWYGFVRAGRESRAEPA